MQGPPAGLCTHRDEEEEGTGPGRSGGIVLDYVMHFLTVFWKVLFGSRAPHRVLPWLGLLRCLHPGHRAAHRLIGTRFLTSAAPLASRTLSTLLSSWPWAPPSPG